MNSKTENVASCLLLSNSLSNSWHNGNAIKALEDMKRKLTTQNYEMEILRKKNWELEKKQKEGKNGTTLKWTTALKQELADHDKRMDYSPTLTGFTHPKLVWEHLPEYLEYNN